MSMISTWGGTQDRSPGTGADSQNKKGARRVLQTILLVALGVALSAGAATYISFRGDMRIARERVGKIPSKVYPSKYGDIEYLMVGEGPTVLISHGVTGGIDQGMKLAGGEFDQFGKGYRFVYVSRFGYLKSALPAKASARLQAAAYKELLDHLRIDKVFVYGNSAGGPSAMWFAAEYPERTKGVILSSSAVPNPKMATAPDAVFESDFLYWAAVKAVPDKLLGLFVPKTYTMAPREKDFFVKNAYEAALPITMRSAGIAFDNKVSTPSVDDVPFERIVAPVLILHAVDDPASPFEGARWMAGRMPNSNLVALDGGHFLLGHDVRPEVREFVGRNK